MELTGISRVLRGQQSADTVEKKLLIVDSQKPPPLTRLRGRGERYGEACASHRFRDRYFLGHWAVADLKRVFGEMLTALWWPSRQWSYLPCFALLLPLRSWRDSIVALICGGLNDDGMSGSSGAALVRLLP